MLSTHIVNAQKLVLIVDNASLERQSTDIIYKMMPKQLRPMNRVTIPRTEELDTFSPMKDRFSDDCMQFYQTDNNVILQPVSQLLLSYTPTAIFWLVHGLKRNPQVKQIFVWASLKNIHQHFVVPYLEHMADLVVEFSGNNLASLLIRKSGGSVKKKKHEYEITDDGIALKDVPKPIEPPIESLPNPASLGTFKIDLDDNEIAARDSLMLPFEKHMAMEYNSVSAERTSQIIYTPDTDDDYDEEDPDDDLDI